MNTDHDFTSQYIICNRISHILLVNILYVTEYNTYVKNIMRVILYSSVFIWIHDISIGQHIWSHFVKEQSDICWKKTSQVYLLQKLISTSNYLIKNRCL
jgi:hypothetical protein